MERDLRRLRHRSAEEAEGAFKGEVERFIYSRYGNPTVEMFQDRMCLLENAEACFAMASGMAAVFASFACQVKAGDRVVGSRALFGSCLYILTDILPRYGVETVIVDGTDYEQWERALAKPTALTFLETPSNPGLEIIDLAKVASQAWTAGAKVYWDNTAKRVTNVASGNTLVGVAVLAVGPGADEVVGRVRLNGSF